MAGSFVRTTSTHASWKLPTRLLSPLPMTMPSASVISTLKPMTAVVSPAISWASDGLSTGISSRRGVDRPNDWTPPSIGK